MAEIIIERKAINPELLDAQLRAVLGTDCLGVSFSGGVVRVHLAATPTPEQAALATAVVRDHDPAALTPAQQAARDREEQPIFRLEGEALAAALAALDEGAFRREVARALTALRDRLLGGSRGV